MSLAAMAINPCAVESNVERASGSGVIITSVNGEMVDGSEKLGRALSGAGVGDKLCLPAVGGTETR